MAEKNAVPDELANKFATEKDKDTPYVRWVTAQAKGSLSALAKAPPRAS